MIDEQHPFEVVHFVLEAGGEQPVDVFFVDLAIQILPARADARRAFDIGVDFGDREAAFGIDRVVFRRIEDHGVDEHPRLALDRLVRVRVPAVRGAFFRRGVLILGLEVDRQHPQRHADLHRSEPDPGGFVHRFEHIGDQRAQVVIERGDGRGDLLEAQIGNFEDFT